MSHRLHLSRQPLRAWAGFHADQSWVGALKKDKQSVTPEFKSLDSIARGIRPNKDVVAQVDSVDRRASNIGCGGPLACSCRVSVRRSGSLLLGRDASAVRGQVGELISRQRPAANCENTEFGATGIRSWPQNAVPYVGQRAMGSITSCVGTVAVQIEGMHAIPSLL